MLFKINTIWSKTNRWHKSIFVFLLLHSGLLPAAQQGFYCNDPKLSHPFSGDTIHWKILMLVTIFPPLLFMVIFEKIYHPEILTEGSKRNNYFLKWYREYIYGFLLNMNIVCALKVFVGEPRPHFFDTCKPEEALTCAGSEFVPKYTCGQTTWLSESAKSFPSGHSSLGVHCGVFIAWYLHVRINKNLVKPKSVIFLTQFVCIFLATFCALSRMYDHRHHWWDVLIGAAIGWLTFYYTVNNLCNNFIPNTESSKQTLKEKENLIESNLEMSENDTTLL